MEQKAVGFTRQLPNVVSLIRIFGTLILPLLMWTSWEQTITVPMIGTFVRVPLVWIIVYLILVMTDGVDGILARGLNATSGLGATLDAIGDALLLVVGGSCVFANFVRDNISAFQFWFYMFIMVQILSDKFIVYAVTKRRFGAGNMLHSIPHKVFAVGAFLMVAYWAFTREIQPWTILTLWAIMTYAVIDELVYLARAATYNVDFKGHGFEKYALRKDLDTLPEPVGQPGV